MQPSYKRVQNTNPKVKKKKTKIKMKLFLVLVLVLIILGYFFVPKLFSTKVNSNKTKQATSKSINPNKNKNDQVVTNQALVNRCLNNTLSQLIVVSINARHLWACDYQTMEYNSPVVTGMEFLAADLTPTGTFQIQNKQTNIVLKGSDSTGSWNDPVSYWMQFLYNQYGAYGFHDATWRPNSAFGNISPNSKNASHGCVELPLATAKWLYNWSVVGTTVQIVN